VHLKKLRFLPLMTFLPLLSPGALGAQVILTLDEFLELRARTLEPAVAAPLPPAPWALESADFAIETGPGSARLRTTLELTVFAGGWQKVPLGDLGSITDLEAPAGLEARIEGGSPPQLLVRGEGRFRLVIASVRPLEKDASATRPSSIFSFAPPPAALVRGTLAALAEVEEALLARGGLLQPAGPQRWTFLAAFAPDARLVFSLFGRRVLPEKALLPLRYEARVFAATNLSRTQLQVQAEVELTVAQGRLEQLWLDFPADLEVVAAEGPGLAGWNVEAGRLRVMPLAPVEESLRFSVRLRGKNVAGFASPLLLPEGSRRTLHLVAAQLRGDGLLDLVEPGSARAATESEKSGLAISAQTPVYALADAARPPRFEAVWAEGTEVLAVQIDRLLVDVALGAGGRAAYQLWAEVRNRGTLSLEITLPPGFELIDADRDGETVVPGRKAGGGFEVPLFAGEESQVVHLRGLLPLGLPAGKAAELALPLPALSAPAARVEARLLLPPRRAGELADASRRQTIGPPPGLSGRVRKRDDALKSNVIAQQLWTRFAPQEAGGLFGRPAGFSSLEAGWSALSSAPAPILVKISQQEEVAPWF